MAKHFQSVGRSAVHVLARLAAQNAIKQKLRDQGVRLSLVPKAATSRRWSSPRRSPTRYANSCGRCVHKRRLLCARREPIELNLH
jgi:hypothetical protein